MNVAGRVLLGVAALVTLAMLVHVGGASMFVAAFAGFALSPYVGMALQRAQTPGSPAGEYLLLAGSVLVAGLAIPYVGAFVLDEVPDAQAGLLFVFVPLYQWMIAGAVWLARWWYGGRAGPTA